MSDHANLDHLAAFAEGLLDRAATEEVGRHLAACAACARRQAALAETARRLRQARPPALPAHIALRLDAALAAEIAATRGAPAEHGATAVPAATAGRGGQAGQRWPARRPAGGVPAPRSAAARAWISRSLRPLAAAASVCLIAGGGFLLARSAAHHPSTTSAASAAPSGTRHQAKSGAALSPGQRLDRAPLAGSKRADLIEVRSKTSYEPGKLRAQAAAVARQYAAEIPSRGAGGNARMQPLETSSALAGCVRRVTSRQQRVIVDIATYQGNSVAVIISPAGDDYAGHVWVVRPRCSASSADLIASTRL